MYTLVAYYIHHITCKKKKTHKITIKIYELDFYSEQAVYLIICNQPCLRERQKEKEREINIFLARFQRGFLSIVSESINV